MRIHTRCYLDGSYSIWRDRVSSNCTKRSGFEIDCTNRSGLEVELKVKNFQKLLGLSLPVNSHKAKFRLVQKLSNFLLSTLSRFFTSEVASELTDAGELKEIFPEASEPASDAGEPGAKLPQASLSPAEAWRLAQAPRSPQATLDPTAPEWWSEETKEYFQLQQNKKSSRKPRGFHGITSEGKKMVRSCCQLIELEANRRPVALLTNTLPSMSRELINQCTERWSEICRQFNQELVRELERNNLPPHYVYVTEWQAKRQALHQHIVFTASNRTGRLKGDEYPISKHWFRERWQRVLENVIGVKFDCSAATRIEKVKKSVSAYMGKYMSKGDNPKKISMQTCTQSDTEVTQVCTELDTFGSNLPSMQPGAKLDTKTCRHDMQTGTQSDTETDTCKHPSAWWGASSALKKKVKALVVNISVEVESTCRLDGSRNEDWINQALNIVDRLDSYWSQLIVVGSGIVMGIAGRIKPIGDYLESFKRAVLIDPEREKIAPSNGEIQAYYYKEYWNWRYKRDGCNRQFDKIAIEEWIANKCNASISYGI